MRNAIILCSFNILASSLGWYRCTTRDHDKSYHGPIVSSQINLKVARAPALIMRSTVLRGYFEIITTENNIQVILKVPQSRVIEIRTLHNWWGR